MKSAETPKRTKKEFSLLLEQGPLRKNEGRLRGVPLQAIAFLFISILILTLVIISTVLAIVTRQEQLRLIATLDAATHSRETNKFEKSAATDHYNISMKIDNALIGDLPQEFIIMLNEEEKMQVTDVITHLQYQFPHETAQRLAQSMDSSVREALIKSHLKLPMRLKTAFINFRNTPNSYGTLLVRGLEVISNLSLPRTPSDGRISTDKRTSNSEYTLLLLLTLLGEPIGYADEKEGVLIHNVIPVAGQETKQENTGSRQFLEFHTENGFHPYKPDYVSLLCLKSDHDGEAITATAGIANALPYLNQEHKHILQQPIFRTHSPSSFRNEEKFSPPMPILTYDVHGKPLLRADAIRMKFNMSEENVAAFDALTKALIRVTIGVKLQPGDLIVIDNNRAMHARTGFIPRFDGEDRWLQRLFVVTELSPTEFRNGHIIAPLWKLDFSESD